MVVCLPVFLLAKKIRVPVKCLVRLNTSCLKILEDFCMFLLLDRNVNFRSSLLNELLIIALETRCED